MFSKILIANRGEIACRVAATCRNLGVRSVAVYSDADAHAAHVQACDEAVHIGGAAASESYLRTERLIQAALVTGAQAIHPGYGFLSENAEFAQACADAGLVFIGPSPAAMRAMGLKAEAKQKMSQAGVPLVPGYHGAAQDSATLQREADAVGYPLLIKASAGGGGKGMRVVQNSAEFAAALAACQREARSSFGNDAVLLERYLTRARHIEIQIFADTHANCIYLFERDCSVQRRHQKVLEEAPAPGLTPEQRQTMGVAAVAAAKAVGYVGAGTVEFIVELQASGSLAFYFMEMNTRLQVEHPVTEAITGLDLVAWQLDVAAGKPLPLAQHELQINGHAIEARLCAENCDEGQFLPATGTLQVFNTPPNATRFTPSAVRIDTGVRAGDAVLPFYDSMIGKLIVWGVDRAQALARLDAALAQIHIVGVHTNVAFLRRVVVSHSFAQANLDTALIAREHAALFNPTLLPIEVAASAVVAHQLAAQRALETADPWSKSDGWRLHGVATQTLNLHIQGELHTFVVEQSPAQLVLTLGKQHWPLSLEGHESPFHVTLENRRDTLAVYATALPHGGTRYSVFSPQACAVVDQPSLIHAANTAQTGSLNAPMPGKVIALLVAVGDTVAAGQPLLVMEAMKMEHTISAPHAGTVAQAFYAVGEQVAEGAELLRLQN
jgi:3-methylcrotonyl-CoA carboxylase alpha subunit